MVGLRPATLGWITNRLLLDQRFGKQTSGDWRIRGRTRSVGFGDGLSKADTRRAVLPATSSGRYHPDRIWAVINRLTDDEIVLDVYETEAEAISARNKGIRATAEVPRGPLGDEGALLATARRVLAGMSATLIL